MKTLVKGRIHSVSSYEFKLVLKEYKPYFTCSSYNIFSSIATRKVFLENIPN